MYKVKKMNNRFDVLQMIEGDDVYNSNFIYKMDQISSTETFSTDFYKGRLDLVARDLYPVEGTTYEGVLAVLNRMTLTNTTEMKDIEWVKPDKVRDSILD